LPTPSSPASSTSLFTIDSILAPRPPHQPAAQQGHVVSPHQRLPPAVLHHPLHLGHLAAAAASGFGTSADFLGKLMQPAKRLCSDWDAESRSAGNKISSLVCKFQLQPRIFYVTKSPGAVILSSRAVR
jgi:hypothetical protein